MTSRLRKSLQISSLFRSISSRRAIRTDACLLTRSKPRNQPISGLELARFAGIATMMRLPHRDTAEGLQACFVGIPIDWSASYRSGTRHGPRQIRQESFILRQYNTATGASPFDSLEVADIGDVNINPYSIQHTFNLITEHYKKILNAGCIPLGMGGDHGLSLPVLRALREKHGEVALIHVDAHSDTTDCYGYGEKYTHGTPFRRAVEEGLISPRHCVQIGLRGSGYTVDDLDWAKSQGFHIVEAHECWYKSMTPVMDSVREMIGDRPIYLSFDIDAIEPSMCPGTGTPEVGGLTVIQALEVVRGCRGLNIVSADVVEVNPLLDPYGTTAMVAANLLFEMLCVLPGVKYGK